METISPTRNQTNQNVTEERKNRKLKTLATIKGKTQHPPLKAEFPKQSRITNFGSNQPGFKQKLGLSMVMATSASYFTKGATQDKSCVLVFHCCYNIV